MGPYLKTKLQNSYAHTHKHAHTPMHYIRRKTYKTKTDTALLLISIKQRARYRILPQSAFTHASSRQPSNLIIAPHRLIHRIDVLARMPPPSHLEAHRDKNLNDHITTTTKTTTEPPPPPSLPYPAKPKSLSIPQQKPCSPSPPGNALPGMSQMSASLFPA